MSKWKILGITLLILVPISGFVLQSCWGLIYRQQPAQVLSEQTTTSGSTMTYEFKVIGHPAYARWGVVVPLFLLLSGTICALLPNNRGRSASARWEGK